jgi:hypothetical protein
MLNKLLTRSQDLPKGPMRWGERFKAAGLHLVLSLVVLGAVAWLTLRYCYPYPFSRATGGYQLLTLLASVDAVLGPALTFCVFNRAKKSLRMDLGIIALLQCAALAYGVWAAVQGRPVIQVHMVDRFEMLTANEVDPRHLSKAPRALQSLGFGTPALAYWQPAKDSAERSELTLISMNNPSGLRQMLERYQVYDEKNAAVVLSRAFPIERLYKSNPKDRVDQAVHAAGLAAADLRMIPLDGRAGHLAVLIDAKTAQVRHVADLDPWEP